MLVAPHTDVSLFTLVAIMDPSPTARPAASPGAGPAVGLGGRVGQSGGLEVLVRGEWVAARPLVVQGGGGRGEES